MPKLKPFAPLTDSFTQETDIEHEAIQMLVKLGFVVKTRKSGNKLIDSSFPSVTSPKSKKKLAGKPDLLLFLKGAKIPFCIWENKSRTETAETGINQSKIYIEGLHKKLPNTPNLPRLAVGFNGSELLISYYAEVGSSPWVELKAQGKVVINEFPEEIFFRNGISSSGILTAVSGSATVDDLRKALWALKTRYRLIPSLTSGRTPIDFTVALLTLRLLVEQNPDWGTWAEQPLLQEGGDREKKIFERLITLSNRILGDRDLKERYGDIFKFKEMEGSTEVAFEFSKILSTIDKDKDNFETLFDAIDEIPPLISSDFDLFGESYQYIGDDSIKKHLGQFFTGRHIISGVIPILFARSGLDKSFSAMKKIKLADIACGTGGFVTESLRWIKHKYSLSPSSTRQFAKKCFYGYDIGHANASRSRVNMYFAGDGFSSIEGGIDTLSNSFLTKTLPKGGFDVIQTNPPYGQSKYGLYEEAFLKRTIECLKKGTGWGLIVLPTGVLENPRSDSVRFFLLKNAIVTDVITLPKHAFAPYTQQKTSIVIINRREKPIPVADKDWNSLTDRIQHEQISFYIVDNDGYANSDKRYPTKRKDVSGRWLHNELTEWTDTNSVLHNSIIFESLINRVLPPFAENEFGVETGKKYGCFEVSELFDNSLVGVQLLPDIFLRRDISNISFKDYTKKANELLQFFSHRETATAIAKVESKLKELLTMPVKYPNDTKMEKSSIGQLFDHYKGDQGFTEEIIYSHFDSKGIPVYGGGAEPPRFRVERDTTTKNNKKISVYKAPAIIVSMDGTSGTMRVIDNGEFCLNHHGSVLKLKDGVDIDLQWVAQQCESKLKRLASNQEGSATLTKDSLLNLRIDVPVNKELCSDVGKIRKRLISFYEDFYQ